MYLIAYGVFRFATEFLRPEPAWGLGLTFYQWVALATVAAWAVQWQFHRTWRAQADDHLPMREVRPAV